MMAQPILPPERTARSVARTRLFLAATMRFARVSAPIRLRDLSTFGARIEGARLPDAGTTVQIVRGTLGGSGTIVWRDSKGCGVRFDEPLDLDAWMPGLASRDQVSVDELVEAVRSGSADVLPHPPPTPPPIPVRALLPARLAEELAYVARLLDGLGEELSGEPLVVMRHAVKLQDLDISAQILGHVAALLVADRPEQAIEAIGMTTLRKRLQRTSL